jgi:hypothetical protein
VAEDPGADVVERLSAGLAEIAPLLEKHALHLWLRRESLSVRYEIAGHELDHTEFMRELLGPCGGNRFPSYWEDASKALRHCVTISNAAGDFLAGSGDDYMRCWSAVDDDRDLSGGRQLPLRDAAGHGAPRRLARPARSHRRMQRRRTG